MKTIGIDIGTTTISGVVIDMDQKNVIESRTVSNGSFLQTAYDWERIQDVDVIVRKAQALLDELLECHPDAAAIGLTGQMHGIVYINKEGKHVSPLYTWQDRRGDLADEKTGVSPVEEIREKTGAVVSSGYGLVTQLSLQRWGLVPEDAAALCTIGDYLGMVLTGRDRPLIHISNAASLGLFDSRNLRFDLENLRKCGISEELLPEVTADVEVLGLYRGIPVHAAIGDNQASFLGAAGNQENVLLINMGTGGQISLLTDEYTEIEGIETRPFAQGKYLLVGASLCGGRAYAVLEQFFRQYAEAVCPGAGPQYEVMERLINGMDRSDLSVSTLFSGTRSNPDLRGFVTNISEDNFTPSMLIYGVLTGMAEELFEMYQKISEATGIRVTKLIASGNGLRKNKALQEICSRMFQAELEMAKVKEEAAAGAARGVPEQYSNIDNIASKDV